MSAMAVTACPMCAEVSSNSPPFLVIFLFWFLLLFSHPQIPVLRTLPVLVDTPPLPCLTPLNSLAASSEPCDSSPSLPASPIHVPSCPEVWQHWGQS